MKIIDKAAWQIDGGVESDIVVAHFKKMFNWLATKNMLTAEGQEVLATGIDGSVSLHERLLTAEGLAFLEVHYEGYLKECPYGEDLGADRLEEIYKDFEK